MTVLEPPDCTKYVNASWRTGVPRSPRITAVLDTNRFTLPASVAVAVVVAA
jgi:hypothetical protein